MNRRVFLQLTGLVAVAGATLAERRHGAEAASVPSGTRLTIREPGTYRISGRVRLEEPLVEIGGATHTQSISWSGVQGAEHRVASFTLFEHFDRPGMTQAIRVRGGRLESVAAVPVDFA